ncbi:ABC-three component system protein [Streptomyces sp. NPDC004579]|uniref:ABC-three component system protein n=1 Tax=Streptomyces sp. NPDC004579 TaxID=3154667 RepID=UPI0033AAB8C2
MSTSQRSSQLPGEPLFAELPKPSQTPVTVVSPMMALPPAVTPKQRLVHYSADDWEEFIYEWVMSLKEAGYVDVVGMGGSNDRGADIAAFLTPAKTDGRWHCYQCKHYDKPLVPSSAYPEILKIHSAVAEQQYRVLPERYVFVAPKLGGSLVQLLAKPSALKAGFLEWATKSSARLAQEYPGGLLERALHRARASTFSCFEAGNLDIILEQHASTPHHVRRFGTPLPDRPARETTPAQHAPEEARYVQQLLHVYGEKWGCSTVSPEEAAAHPKAGRNLQNQREAFYRAEQLRLFARDSVPDGTFESLQEAVFSGVVEVEEDDFPTGWARLKAVLAAARDMQLGTNVLLQVVDPDDRKGICHQLANVDRLTWVQGAEQ